MLHLLKIIAILTLLAPFSCQSETLTAPGAEVREIAKDFKFTEGPAWKEGHGLFFTDNSNNRIYLLKPDGQLTVYRDPSGGANGMYIDKTGNLFACEGPSQRVTRDDLHGNITTIADTYEGKPFNCPNDLWVSPSGGIYFTDPVYGKHDQLPQSGEHVYYLPPGASTGGALRVIDDMVRPNGILGTPDGTMLYVADHGSKQTWRYHINTDGTLSEKTLFVPRASDGLAMDDRGNLYLTDGPYVAIYSPEGQLLQEIPFPQNPANVTFGGDGLRTLYVTARTGLYSIDMSVSGIRP